MKNFSFGPALRSLWLVGATLALLSGAQAQRPAGGTLITPELQRNLNARAALNTNLVIQSPSILAARGALGTDKLNQVVTVRGFYYDGSIPMIVDSIERVQCDMMMPPQSYVPLAAPLPNLRNGDEVGVTGRMVAPSAAGLKLLNEASVLKLESEPNQAVQKFQPRSDALANFDPKILRQVPNINTGGILQNLPIPGKTKGNASTTTPAPEPKKPLPTVKYAVLLVGGGDNANNHPRYWNDLKTMYLILQKYGYDPQNITVIYAGGVGRDGSMPVNYSATRDNIKAVFANLGAKMTDSDTLYLMINDHGGGFLAQKAGDYTPGNYGGVLDTTNSVGAQISESQYDLDLNGNGTKTDLVHIRSTVVLWGESMSDGEFKTALAPIKKYRLMMIQMKQCFSGGFADALRASKRVVMSSCGPNEVSWATSNAQYGAFTYAYFSALAGHTPDGAKIDGNSTPNADLDNTWGVTLGEAWNFALAHDSKPEHGLYSENGAPPNNSSMPNAVQGNLGNHTSL